MQTRPDMRGNLKPPTLDLFWLFRFRVPCTGRTILFDETPLDPHSETHMATIYLYERACEDYFLYAQLPAVEPVASLAWEVVGGCSFASRGGGRATERERTPEDIPIGYCTPYDTVAYVFCIQYPRSILLDACPCMVIESAELDPVRNRHGTAHGGCGARSGRMASLPP